MLLTQDFSVRLAKAFPGSEWLTTLSTDEGLVSTPEDSLGTLNISKEDVIHPKTYALIGGTKFDEAALETWLKSLPPDTVIVTGDGRGAEKRTVSLCNELGIRVDTPGQLKVARPLEVQIEAVMAITQDSRAPVVLVGQGGRVNSAKSWLKRGRFGREVIELACYANGND